MLPNTITVPGKILFEPENETKKHLAQASWKRFAMITFEGDICQLYAWFIKKRYNIVLNKNLRGPHISFINDSVRDIMEKNSISEQEANGLWEKVKAKWDGKDISVVLTVDPRSDSNHWYLNVPEENRYFLHQIRAELGLGRPYFGLHMTIGIIHPSYVEHSKYIIEGLQKGHVYQ